MPLMLAAKTDTQLSTLRNATLNYRFSWFKDSVGSAYADCEAKIVSPKEFWIQLPNIDTHRKDVINFETWKSDGRRFGRSIYPDRPRPGLLSSRPGLPAKPATAWFSDFSRIILSGVGQTTHPFANLVKDAVKGGFKATTQFRRLRLEGKEYVSYRLVLAKGAARYETVIDGRRFLPVSVTNTVGKVDNSRWSGPMWTFPKKPIDASVTRFTTGAKGTAPSAKPRPR